jgi:hypothetical protein
MIREEQGIVADIATQVVGKLSGSYSRDRIASFAVILHRLYLPSAQRHWRLLFAFSDLCHEQRVPDRQSHELRASKPQLHNSAVIRTPPTQPQSSIPQHESTAKTLLCASLVITKYTTPALDGCGRDCET